MWVVYALYNRNIHRFYIGQTNNLYRRIREHKEKRGKHFTAKAKGVWELVYREECTSRRDAITREKQLKSYRGREFIKKFTIPL